jgi:hypothetical protein
MPQETFFIVLAVIGIWLLVISFLLLRLSLHYQRLTGDVNKKDLVSCLNQLISQTKTNHDEIESVRKILETEIENNKAHLQRLGFKRFNPFTDTGGNQSFAMSLLDENLNGIVISSLHSRESTRIYAKKIISGKSENQDLSKEETEVIRSASPKK